MVAGALIANAQNSRPAAAEDALRPSGGGDAAADVPMHSKLAMQLDSVKPGPRDFLEPNAPNPFGVASLTTRIAFTIAQPSRVELRIYDFFYNEVVTLIDSDLPPGRHVMEFNPPPTMPSGMYFYELKTNHFRDLRRMVYIK